MMNLTPKAQALKSFFPTKKPMCETRSKRKLDLSSLTPVADKTEASKLEKKKGKIDSLKPACAFTPTKQNTPAKQTTLLNFLTPKLSAPLPTSDAVIDSQPLITKPPALVDCSPRMLSGPATTKATICVPAYLRYASLSCKGSLALPEHMSSLEKNFKYMFHTMLYQRVMWNTFTFHQMQPAIEKTSKRSFPISQLGQFKELFPDLFEFESTKAMHNYKAVDSVFIKVPSLGLGSQLKESQNLDIYPTERIEALCKELHSKLVNIVHKHHNDFLLSRRLPTFAGPPSKWHPDFDLTTVPHIVSQPLFPVPEPVAPRATLAERAKLLCARSAVPAKPMGVLERAKALLNKKAASENVIQLSFEERKSALSRQSEELLNRIKAKEKQRLDFEAENPNLKEDKQVLLHLSQLPAVVRSLKAIFATSTISRPTKPLDEVTQQIATKSVYQLSVCEVKSRLELLVKAVPTYASIKYFEHYKKHFISLRDPSLTLDYIKAKLDAYKNERSF